VAQIGLSGIRKAYGREVVVHDLDLTIRPGEFLTILGPSGCGKTTTLRAIAGLEEPDDGDIHLGEKLVFSRRRGVIVPPEKRGVGLIFQSYALWPHMTVQRNVSLALEEKGLGRAEIEARATRALETVQMTALGARYPSELSGGQQQRVAVARMIALRPQILLMDEPLSNLDAKLRLDMRAELLQLHRDLGSTTVYVTHDQAEALTLSDRIVVMDRGRVLQEASPYEVYHHPRSLQVAEFIGEPRINLVPGTLLREADALYLVGDGVRLPAERARAAKGERLVAAVRPENIELSTVPVAGWQEVRLDNVQPTGATTILQVCAGATRLRLVRPGFLRIEAGIPLWIGFDADSIEFFDPDTQGNVSAP
jgi:ABC-type sugar transport system ATPase subunit